MRWLEPSDFLMTLRLTKSTTALLLALLSLSACGGTPEQKEARYLKHGEKLFEEGSYNKARVEYLNAAHLRPTDANAIYHLGLVDDAQGNFRDAFNNFTNAEQQDGHFHPALLKLAEYYLAGDQYAQANQRIDAVLAETPDDAQARALLAARFLRQKQYDEAENEAHKSLASDPNNVLAFGVLAGSYKAKNDMDKAVATLEEGAARNPKNETILRLEAEIYEQQGNLEKAAQAYQTLFTVVPLEKKYRLRFADDYVKNGQLDQAEAVLRGGVAAMPADWEMKHQLILFLTEHRGVTTTEQELRQYMSESPDSSEPVDWLVDLYLTKNMPDQANNFLDQIIADDKQDQLWLHAMTAKAKIYYLKQEPEEAGKLLAAILKKDPNNLNAQFIKAHVDADKGLFDQAIIDLRGIIRDKPQSKDAYELSSNILLAQGHKDLAIDMLNQLADIAPLTVEQQVRLAQLYALNGDVAHARDLLLIATKTDPNYPVGWEMTARLSLELKDWTTADAAIDTLDGLPSQHLTALLLRAEKLSLTGKQNDATAAYKELINADPSSPQAEHALPAFVQTYRDQHQLADVIPYLESLPPTALIETLIGEAEMDMGNNEKAAAALDKAIASHARQQDPYIERARIYVSQKNVDAALDLLKQATTVNTSDMRAPLAQAQLSEQFGHYEDALKLYSDLLEKNPSSDLIANNLAEEIADHDFGNATTLEKARQVAERFTASPNPLLLDTLGWVYYRQRRLQDALTIFGRAAALSANALPPQFHYHYGMALLGAHNSAQAETELKLAVVKGQPYPGQDDAEKALAELTKSH